MKKIIPKFIKYLVLAALVYMPLFGFLNSLPIRKWDESRLAMNAYEMLHDNNYLVTHYEGNPDMWNTKPPLMIWLQVFFMKIMGASVLAVRIPSALAALFTCIVLIVFFARYLKQEWIGFIAVLVLITSSGYISLHVSRTGDYDALLILFTTLSGLFFFSFTETRNRNFLYLFFITAALSVLTKSIAGLLFMPALVIYAIIQKQFFALFKNRHFYYGLMIFVVLVFGYYLLREHYNPGYLRAVQQNELGGRYLQILENHKHDFWYYYDFLKGGHMSNWYLLIPGGILVGLFNKNKQIKRITLFSTLMVVCYFLVISISKTKLSWYEAPLFPFLSILVAVFLYFVFDLLKNLEWVNKSLSVNVLPFVFLFLITINPYRSIVDKTYKPKDNAGDKEFYGMSYFLQDALKGKHELNDRIVLNDGYDAHLRFYVHLLQDKQVNIAMGSVGNLQEGDTVIFNGKNMIQILEKKYEIELIKKDGNIFYYRIIQPKE